MNRANSVSGPWTMNRPNPPDWWSRDLAAIESVFHRVVAEKLENHAPMLCRAKGFAKQRHSGQLRQGGGPYVIHPLRVAISLVVELMVLDPDLVMAGLLHDVIEDSDCSEEVLSAEFGPVTAKLVATLSRRADERRPAQGDSVDSPYLRRVRESGERAVLLKTADKVDNLRDALYHPRKEKRQVYVEEATKAYIPLVESVADGEVQNKLRDLLIGAAEAHSMKSLIGIIHEQTQRAQYGESVIVPPACLDAPLIHYLLFNPMLDCWLSDDGVQLTKSVPPNGVAVNVARKYAQFIRDGRVKELLDIAGCPRELANARNRRHWKRAAEQLEEIVRLVQEATAPEWCVAAFEPGSARWLLLVVHSVLFRPANWIFPMWHPDYGAALSENVNPSRYRQIWPESDVTLFHKCLRFLLISREALWRLSTGVGTRVRAQPVFDGAASLSEIPIRTRWSVRLLSEYLDVIVEGGAHASDASEGFTKLWEVLIGGSVHSGALTDISPLSDCEPRLVQAEDIESLGLSEVAKLFRDAGRSKEFGILLRLLSNRCRAEDASSDKWISFEISEFLKRRELFESDALSGLKAATEFAHLERSGIRTRPEPAERLFVLKVLPSRRFALQNRLPELLQADVEKIESLGCSATAIFDTLVLSRKAGEVPVWVPRVYRILDTIEDLAPEDVQTIAVTFRCSDGNAYFKTYLPLPATSANPETQENRKRALAQYLVAQIYNYGITRRVLSVDVDCSVLHASRASVGFTTEDLMEMIRAEEAESGLRGSYGRFIESFNFSPFRISGEGAFQGELGFDREDMRSGLFLGIDIGGTDVKFGLFLGGEPQVLGDGEPVGRFPTFSDSTMDAKAFCERLVSEISQRLTNSATGPSRLWNEVQGIGISWPGAVRENRIAGASGTLARLKYQKKRFASEPSPADIHSFPFLDLFRMAVEAFAQRKGIQLDPSLMLVLENDGNAEAFGNYCSRILEGRSKPGGKVIIKLGTSLAGGRVRPDSSIAADVAEFSKIILNLSDRGASRPSGVARGYVSSLGVRNLSRTFHFGKEKEEEKGKETEKENALFGERDGANTEEKEAKATRIEAVELGELVTLVHDEIGGPIGKRYLEELVREDNRKGPAADDLAEHLHKLLSAGLLEDKLKCYAMRRGEEWYDRHSQNNERKHGGDDGQDKVRRRGVERIHWLCIGSEKDYSSLSDLRLPLIGDALIEKIVGTIALFSQLALQIAHLIAELYNIYRRDSFNEVILAGGVLAGATGELVKGQTEGFLLKYYDKIYGSGKSLGPGAIQLVDVENRDLTGPLGVAMLASRAHKGARMLGMARLLDYLIARQAPGRIVSLAQMVSALREAGVSATEVEVRDYIYLKVAESVLIPQADGETFVRPVESSPSA